MSATVVRTQDIPVLGRVEAMTLAATEYERFGKVLRTLTPDDWSRPTDCDRWDVKGVVSHHIRMSEAMASVREMMRQQRAGKPFVKHGLSSFDAWTEHQARSLEQLEPAEVVERYDRAVGAALPVRRRPSPLRLVRFPFPPYGLMSISFLRDVILTRDTWMHRVDVSRATGSDIELTPDHDGRFVADIVRDLGRRWRRPFALDLTGAAGGRYVNGEGGEPIELDAVEFCRILSGRSTGEGLPTDVVPF